MKNILKIFLSFLILLQIFSSSIKCLRKGASVFQGQALRIRFKLQGVEKEFLEGLSLSYHLYSPSGKLVRFENPRFKFRILKGHIYQSTLYFSAPAGSYYVELDLVREGKFWVKDKGWTTCKFPVRLKSIFSPDFKNKYMNTLLVFENKDLVRIQYLIRVTFLNDELRKEYGLFGISPGSDYPQVWIRDAATFLDFAQLYYPLSALEKMVELFLKFQHSDGEVLDWIGTNFSYGKNTVSSDQESSLVLAAFSIAKKKPKWLEKKIRGKKVIERLEDALDWLWKYRKDSRTGLIWSGFKADWGDVSVERIDDPTHYHSGDLRVVGIYTQAKYYQALLALAKMEEMCGREKKSWLERALEIKKSSLRYLYLPERGYFLIHRVLGHPEFFNMEKDILAIGGNSEAILADFVSKSQARRFFNVLEDRMRKHGLPSPSFVLIPPYPEGFFKHPLMKPWHYQNGGAWDWIGARLVRAMLKTGMFKKGVMYLRTMVERDLKNMCFYEWMGRDMRGKGAMFYSGAGGQIGKDLLVLYTLSHANSLDQDAIIW